MKTNLVIGLSVLLLVGAVASEAQAGRIDKRQRRQAMRIEQGVKSGELTKGEAKRLSREEHRINRMEKRARADGKVTAKEHAKIEAAQDKANKDIQEQKHD